VEARATSIGSTINGIPGGGGSQDKIGNHVAIMADIAEMINRELTRAHERMRQIETSIEILEEREKRLMRLRYLHGLSWEKICVDMNFSWRQIHNIHAEALKKIT
jgi:RNA polymerase sigma factor (sigma-70 family)